MAAQGQGSRPTQVEPTDPLYVHPSDNPAQPLVSNTFNGENYDGWKRSVYIALSARHKLAFIDGTSECPAATTPLYSLWQRNNAMVLSWLLNSLSENIRNALYIEPCTEEVIVQSILQVNKTVALCFFQFSLFCNFTFLETWILIWYQSKVLDLDLPPFPFD